MQIFEGDKARWNDGRKRNREGRGRIPKSGTLAKAPAERDHRCGPGLQMRMKNTQRRVKTGKNFFNACYLSVRWNEYFLSRWKSGTAFSGTKIRNFSIFFNASPFGMFFAFGRSLCGGGHGHSGPSDFWVLPSQPFRRERGLILLARVPGRWRHRPFPSSLP